MVRWSCRVSVIPGHESLLSSSKLKSIYCKLVYNPFPFYRSENRVLSGQMTFSNLSNYYRKEPQLNPRRTQLKILYPTRNIFPKETQPSLPFLQHSIKKGSKIKYQYLSVNMTLYWETLEDLFQKLNNCSRFLSQV